MFTIITSIGVAIAIVGLAFLLRIRTKRKPERELVFVSWSKGDKMILANEGWRVAPEEDKNRQLGMVWLERDVRAADCTPPGRA